MDTSLNHGTAVSAATAPSSSRPLWIAIAALGTVTVALGATLVYTQFRQPAANTTGQTALTAAETAPSLPGTAVSAQKQPLALVKPGETAPKNAVKVVPKAPPVYRTPERQQTHNGASSYPSNVPVIQPAPRQVCTNCGEVETVTPVQRAGQGSGLGVVAGGVLGAIVGNQVGKGNGRTAATVLGALGGGYAGNAVEKNIKKETAYQVRVRMEDGAVRTLEQSTAPALGARVTVDGNALRGSDGAVYAPVPASPNGYPRSGYLQTSR